VRDRPAPPENFKKRRSRHWDSAISFKKKIKTQTGGKSRRLRNGHSPKKRKGELEKGRGKFRGTGRDLGEGERPERGKGALWEASPIKVGQAWVPPHCRRKKTSARRGNRHSFESSKVQGKKSGGIAEQMSREFCRKEKKQSSGDLREYSLSKGIRWKGGRRGKTLKKKVKKLRRKEKGEN